MTQRIIDWPKQLRMRPGAQEWELLQPMTGSVSAFSGASYDKLIGPPRWAFSMDLTDAPASTLPQIEAALRQLRGGLNLLRIGDMRSTGRVSVVPGGGAKEVQMLPWSSQWTRWGRIGPAPVAIAGEEVEVRQTTDYFQNATASLRAGVPYVAVVEASATVSAHVALSVAGAGVAAPLGVVFDALTGAVVSQYGPVNACGSTAAGGRWRCWLTFGGQAGDVLAQAYALLPAHGLIHLKMRRPILAMQAGALPPAYVPADSVSVWDEYGVQVDGAGQTGATLATRNWPPGLTLRAGHWISYGDGMHMLLEAATPDSDGKVQLWIEPPIRRSPADGAPVVVRNVTGLFKLKVSPKIRQEGMAVKGQTLTFEEDLNAYS